MKSFFSLMQKNLLPIAALVTSLIIAAILATVVVTPIYLTSSGPYSTKQHAIYTTTSAILATIFTAFIASQVRGLLLRQVDGGLQDISRIKSLGRRWRVILKIGSLVESVRYPAIVTVYLLTSLITTAIVAGLTPDLKTRNFPYSPKISYGPSICTGTYPLAEVENDGRPYYWDFGNGSAFFIPANGGGCPTRYATMLAGNVNPVNPDVFAYADGGVAVLSSAIGTPLSIYSSQPNAAPDFNSLLNKYGPSVVSTTQCVPVMRQNPITCRPGGTVSLGSYQMNLTSSDGLCFYPAEFPFFDPLKDNTMASIMCAHGQVGQGTIVMGASGGYTRWLAASLNDAAHVPPNPGATYVVTCTVDTRDVWEYRTVTLNLQSSNASGSSYARSLLGHEPCHPTPGTNAIDEVLIATSAAANWEILSQNQGLDGYFDLLNDLTGDNRPPPYAFNHSANALEDVLGLISALVASRINSSKVAVDGTAVVTATIVGSGKSFSFAFIVPPAAAAIVLFYLIVTTHTSKGDLYKSSKMGDLIEFGQTLGMKSSPGQQDLTMSSAAPRRSPYRVGLSPGYTLVTTRES
jgi:hypothetical protein